jgi:hypothetical protein
MFRLLFVALFCSPAFCAEAPRLDLTGTRIVRVATEGELQAAMGGLRDGDTIVLSPGTYRLTSSLYINGPENVTIRGDSGSTNVVLAGKGMDNANHGGVPFGVWSNSKNTTIAHLTIRDTYDNEIIFNPGAHSAHVYSVRLINAGSQFIKSNPQDVNAGKGNDNGVVEYCWFEYTGNPPADHGAGVGYFNGISAHAAKNWIVRKCVFKNLHNPDGTAYSWNPAVLFWRNSSNTVTEQNTFINVDRAVAYGLDNSTPYRDHNGGAIRNNFVYLAPGFFSANRKASSDGAIIAWNSPGTQIDQNTLLLNQNTFYSIEFRFATTTNAAARNNLSDTAIHLRDNAKAALTGNLDKATPAFFVNPGTADLHLLPSAAAAINKVAPVNTVTNDFDGEIRPGSNADIGADELSLLTPPRILDFSFAGLEWRVRFTSVANLSYAVERTDDLAKAWAVAQNYIPGTGSPIEIAEPGEGLPRQFYRIKMVQ